MLTAHLVLRKAPESQKRCAKNEFGGTPDAMYRTSRWVIPASCLAMILACQKKSDPPPVEEGARPSEAKGEDKPKGRTSTLPKMPVPDDNPQTPEKIALGHQLFFEKRLSVDGSRSCYSCHQNEHGNGGGDPVAIGPGDKKLTRHSPVIWNVGYFQAFYWDGRSPSLEKQALAAWAGGNMAVGSDPDKQMEKVKEILAIEAYAKQFAQVFPGEEIGPKQVMQAISAYERTLVCDDTAWDRAQNGDESAMTDEQKEGWELFQGKAGCVACHGPPFFSSAMGIPNGVYYNVGIGTQVKKDEVDVGRMSVTKEETDWAAFKPPSLRNVSKSAPYFHDGSIETLEAAVRYMANGAYENDNLSPLVANKNLSDEEIDALVAFLGALDCGKLEFPTLP